VLLTKIRFGTQQGEYRHRRIVLVCTGHKAQLHLCESGLTWLPAAAGHSSLACLEESAARRRATHHVLINGSAIRIHFSSLKIKERHPVKSTVKGGAGESPARRGSATHHFLFANLIHGSAIRIAFNSLKIKERNAIRSTVKGVLRIENEPTIKPMDAARPLRIQTPPGGSSRNETSRR